MIGGLGIWELLIILAIVLLIFGAGKLPEIGAGLGKGISNFKRATGEAKEIDVTPDKKEEASQNEEKKEENKSA
jgi:sec-independent protein translocase protein TatA